MKSIPSALATFLALATTALGQVVISEIHYHPVEEPVFNSDGTPFLQLTNDVHEFVEIQNAGATPLALDGWTLAGGISYTFPTNTTLNAGAFCTIAKTPTRLATVYGLSPATVLGPYAGYLGNGSDTVRLRDAAGSTIEAVTYDSRFPWAASADALGAQDRFTGLSSTNYQYKGRSLQRVSVSWPSSDPANWLASPLTGPTPGGPQAVTRAIPKPVITAQSAAQTTNGATIVRANNAVTVTCTFSATNALANVTLEYFVDDINSTTETRTAVAMTDLGAGCYTAAIPGKTDRSIVRYRFKADRGDGLEVVSPRADDPQIAPVGSSGAREAWHGYFVTPVRTSTNPIYDVFVATAALTQLNLNITQTPKRVTLASATGKPRDIPYVAATAPLWDGTQPGVFACNGEVWDIQIRYHGSIYHRAAANNSFKLHFPEHQPFNNQSSWFETGHGAEFIEAQKLNRMIGLPASRMRTVDWYYNTNAKITRSEQGEYAGEMLEEYHDLQQQLNPGAAKEAPGELYKVVGNRDPSQNNNEGPYTRGDSAPLAANAGWPQLSRYAWTMSLQTHGWKGSKPIRDLIEGMWAARGDTPATHNFSSSTTSLANARAWFTNNWDIDTTLTSMALLEWMSIWDDAAQNHFFWRRANGKWSRLGWDYDQVMSTSGGGGGPGGGGSTQTIYGGEYGATTVFDGVNWWKDTFYKCFRTEYQQRLWELNNSFFDPTNLTALGFTTAATFAQARRTYVNTQLAALGTYFKPNRPTNTAPANGAVLIAPTNLTTSPYSHAQSAPHTATRWEIRAATGDYETPVLRLTSTLDKLALPVPFDQLTYGQTYYWRATHIDTNGHPSVVSAETRFTWGSSNTTAGTLVLNEVLAMNRSTVQNAGTYPDYIELRNNGATPIALAGYSLTDDPLLPARFAFPTNTTIAAGACLLVWCDTQTNAPGLHTGFALDGEADQVILLNGSTIVDSVAFGPQAPDVSIGRIVNGTGGWQANTPTPATANSAKTLGNVTSLRINEWLADPAYGDDWFELYNTDTNLVALAGLYLSDTPSTPTLTRIPALSFIAGHGHARFWADGSTAGGNHANFKLSRSGESLVLTAANGETALDTVTFSAQTTEVARGRLPDGTATFVSFTAQTASPGYPNWTPAPVQINELLANATAPFEDAIELHNSAADPIDIAGWWLSNDRFNPRKFAIPAGTVLPADGYVVFYASQLAAGTPPFSLDAAGGEVVLSAIDNTGALTGYGSLARFGPALENVSLGRIDATGLGATAAGVEFWPLLAPSFGIDQPADLAQFRTGHGAPNAAPNTGTALINEVMYHPPDAADGSDNTRDEFIELFNPTLNTLNLEGWRLRGDSEFTFPAGATLDPGAYLLLVSFNPAESSNLAAFITRYTVNALTPILGPYTPRLQNNSQNLELAAPATIEGTPGFVLVDKVNYRDLTPWPTSPDGAGHSLQRISRTLIGNTAANWAGATPTPGALNAGVVLSLAIVTPSPLPGAVVHLDYSTTLAATGGTAPYSWSRNGDTVPGLDLSDAGVLSGIPANPGVFAFSARVADAVGAIATTTWQITVASDPLAIPTTSTLPDGAVTVPYSQSLTATGGTPPYAWKLAAGAPPPGLTLDGTGTLAGIPTAPGAYSFTTRVADGGGLTASRTFTVFIPIPPLTITSLSPLPSGLLDTFYSQALTAVGGVTPYSWTVSGGALPTGLTLNTNGTLSGTPTAHGTFAFEARVTDTTATAVTKPITFTVTPQPLVITAVTLPEGIAGDTYAQTLSATGGIPPFTWKAANGSLPPDLALTAAGVLTGPLEVAGNYTFSVQVTDSLKTVAAQLLALTVNASGPLDHFAWDSVPTYAYAQKPFAVRLTARDTAQRIVTDFDGPVTLAAASGSGSLASPLLVTELTDAAEDQFEIQNVSAAAVDTTGWFIRIGDSLTDINTVNPITYTLSGTLAAGGLLRITESSTTTTGGRRYFGAPINWSSSAGPNVRGWIMLIDASYKVRDFVPIGWTATDLATLSVLVNGNAVTVAGQWSGTPLVPGTRTTGNTYDSWQRLGTNDLNTASDWVWRHNANGTDATSFNATNPGLILPWATATPVPVTPTTLTLIDGLFAGTITIDQTATQVRLTATDDADHSVVSNPIEVTANPDTDNDGIPDSWERDHGLVVGVDNSLLDTDADGATDLAEYLAGTDPRLPGSRFEITAVSLPAPGRFALTWTAVAGKSYRIRVSTDIAQTAWTPLGPAYYTATTTGSLTTTLDLNLTPNTPHFFRIDLAP